MFKRYLLGLLLVALLIPAAHAVEGMVTIKSSHSVSETVNRLEQALSGAGF